MCGLATSLGRSLMDITASRSFVGGGILFQNVSSYSCELMRIETTTVVTVENVRVHDVVGQDTTMLLLMLKLLFDYDSLLSNITISRVSVSNFSFLTFLGFGVLERHTLSLRGLDMSDS